MKRTVLHAVIHSPTFGQFTSSTVTNFKFFFSLSEVYPQAYLCVATMKLLKRIRRIAHSQRTTAHSATNNLSPISFHSVHGENVRLSANGTIATRINSFCKGICFTNRPIKINERVCVRFLDISQLWSGLLRFGFTSKDPATFRHQLPKYACPDLTNSGHTFAKALPERYAQKGNVLHFYVTSSGNVHFGINGVDKGIILSNVKLNGPLWAVIDLYGNTAKIETIDPRHQLNNRSVNNLYETGNLYSSVSMVDLPNGLAREPSPQIYSDKCLEPMQFHRHRGCNVRLSSDRCIAERSSNHYSQGYVFTQRPLCIGEKIMLQVLKTDQMFVGSLAFGLTSCDPAHLTEFPEDSHQLLDRAEYWVVIKDVASSPMAGDEIAFCISESGEVQMTKNRQRPVTLMHVDISQPLWGFFDLYGSTLKMRVLGTQHTTRYARSNAFATRPLTGHNSISMHNVHKQSDNVYVSNKSLYKLSTKSENQVNVNLSNYQPVKQYQTVEKGSSNSGSLNTLGNECVVCYEEPINSVFYTCGHVCMCFKCSIKQWKTFGHCPICRARIVDVIRTYWS